MSDAHKVKEFLLEWLLTHGREPVNRYYLWHQGEWELAESCIKQGYLDTTRSDKTYRYKHALTDKGLEFLNKGENNEQ